MKKQKLYSYSSPFADLSESTVQTLDELRLAYHINEARKIKQRLATRRYRKNKEKKHEPVRKKK